MKKVGIRDLKNNLSKYIVFVKKGETILVTDHNNIVAEITRPHFKLNDSLLLNFLEEQNRLGKIKLAKKNNFQLPQKNKLKKIDYKKIYEQNRSERFQRI